MDGINRYDLSKIVKQPANPETEAEQSVVPQSSPQTSANPATELVSTDGIENFQRGGADPFNSPAIDPHHLAEQTPPDAGHIDLTPLVSARVDTTQQKWNTLTYLLDEMSKTPPDQTGLFRAVLSLTPQDRKAVLEQLASQGKAPNSDLDKLVKAMYGSGESVASQDMGYLLADLARDVHNDPSEGGLFNQIYADTLSTATTDSRTRTVLSFLNNLSGDSNPGMQDILKSLPSDPLEYMEAQLRNNPQQLDAQGLHLYHELDNAYFLSKGFSPDQAAQQADQGVNKFLDAIPPSDPDYAGYFSEFPEWGTSKLVGLSADPALLTQVVQNLVNGQPPETLTSILTGLTNAIAGNPGAPSVSGSPADIAETFRQILSTLQDMQQAGGGGPADDIIRGLVDSLNPDAMQTLSKLPPNLLIKMLSILTNGDDRVLSSEAENAISQALYIAEH